MAWGRRFKEMPNRSGSLPVHRVAGAWLGLARTKKHARLPPVSRLAMNMDAPVSRTVSLLAALAIASSSLSACAAGATKRTTGEPANFEGVWTGRMCNRQAPERECGVFTLYLAQEAERICGRFKSTPSSSTPDQGVIVGVAVGSAMLVTLRNESSTDANLIRLDMREGHMRGTDIGAIPGDGGTKTTGRTGSFVKDASMPSGFGRNLRADERCESYLDAAENGLVGR